MSSMIKGFGLLGIFALMSAIVAWTEYGESNESWDLAFAIGFTILGILGVWWQIKENRDEQGREIPPDQ